MKIRLTYTYLYLLCVFFTSSIPNTSAQKKITDTIYYDRSWIICEKPVAFYYRIGTLVVTNSLWYYSGKFSDFRRRITKPRGGNGRKWVYTVKTVGMN